MGYIDMRCKRYTGDDCEGTIKFEGSWAVCPKCNMLMSIDHLEEEKD